MKLSRKSNVPLTALALLKVVSGLVPSRQRWEWSQEWHSELWYVHREWRSTGETAASTWVNSVRFCLGAVNDAIWLRRNGSMRTRLLESAQRCGLFLSSLAVICLIVAMLLPGSRRAILSHRSWNTQGLVLISRTGLSNASLPSVDIFEYRKWESRARYLFPELAFYRPLRSKVRIGSGASPMLSVAVASNNLAQLLGLGISSEVLARAKREQLPALALTHAAVERMTGHAVVSAGEEIELFGRRVLVAGILPDDQRAVPGQQDAWLLVDDTQLDQFAPGMPGFVVAQVSKSILMSGKTGRWSFSSAEDDEYVGFDCVPLKDRIVQPTATFLFALLLAFLALPATTPLPLGEYPAAAHPLFNQIRWRRWAFLFVKIGLAVLVVYFGSTVLAFGSRNLAPESSQMLELSISFAGLLFCFRWALRDQRLRCPVCLRLLKNPAHVGHASRSFLAWHGTELMCDRGHGLLHVPEIATSWFSTQRWLNLDSSWRGLFPDSCRSFGVLS